MVQYSHRKAKEGDNMNQMMDVQFYNHIKEILTAARNKVYASANYAMVEAYWNIGKSMLNSKAEKHEQNMARNSCRSFPSK